MVLMNTFGKMNEETIILSPSLMSISFTVSFCYGGRNCLNGDDVGVKGIRNYILIEHRLSDQPNLMAYYFKW